MINAQFRIRLPDELWVTDLSRTFPTATFRLLAGLRTDELATELGEIVTDNPERCIDALQAHPSISNIEILESSDRRVLGKYETSDTQLYEFVELAEIPVEFPVTITNGWFEFDFTGTSDDFDQFQIILETNGMAYELLSLMHTSDTDTLLTTRQRELLELAVREGYFEVPRECTLSELSSKVGIDKATASVILRRGEGTIVKWFLTGPEMNVDSQ